MKLKQKLITSLARTISRSHTLMSEISRQHLGVIPTVASTKKQLPHLTLITTPNNSQARIRTHASVSKLRRFSHTIPVRRAIKRIKRGILGLRWHIVSADISQSPTLPNDPVWNCISLPWPGLSFNDVLGALIEDIIVLGFAAVHRQPGSPDRPFFFRDIDAGSIGKILDWTPDKKSPRYILLDKNNYQGRPIYDHELFLLEYERNSHDPWPTSPVDVAMTMIESWLGLLDWQDQTTSQAHQEYILNLKGMDYSTLQQFRQYWQTEVIGSGRQAIVSVDSIESVKVGAKTDRELYLEYQERITSFLALAFDLTRQDFNLESDVNRATAMVNADAVFDQVIRPLALFLEEKINLEIISRFAPESKFEFVDVDPRRDLQETQRTTLIWRYGGMSYNEFRTYNGLPPIPGWDDVILIPTNFLFVRRSGDDLIPLSQPNLPLP